MVPQYWSYGSAGVPAVPAIIFMSGSCSAALPRKVKVKKQEDFKIHFV